MTMDDLTVYENMSILAEALPVNDRDVLVGLWRRRTYGESVVWHTAYVIERLPPLWSDVLAVTMPSVRVLNRWERDHGYQSR